MKKTLLILLAAITAACSSRPNTENRETIWSLNSTFSKFGNKYAVANAKGTPITEYIYDALEGLSNGNILATANGRKFLLSKEGNRIDSLEFDSFNYCFNDCAIIGSDGRQGLISISGKLHLPMEYNTINFITSQLAVATNGTTSIIIDNRGHVIEETTLHPDSILHNLPHYEELLRNKLLTDAKYWDTLLDSYESLCNSCLEVKILAKSSKKSRKEIQASLQDIIKEAMAVESMLKESSGRMTSQQLERFNGITGKYENYEK